MIDTDRSSKRGWQAPLQAQRYADGVIASYIHELSARHAEEARNHREPTGSRPTS